MDAAMRIETALRATLDEASAVDGPPRLAEALDYAVFPGGARVRPRLTLAVAAACGAADAPLVDAAAAAIELLHCASLVHDDLPCFDDATMRRGKPALHAAYGQRLAVLAGDALIVLAFETLGRAAQADPSRLVPVLMTVAGGVGAPHGIVAGQAWECEPSVGLSQYQQAKTGALFAAATMAGAAAAGVDPAPWGALGERLGEAYQVADDLRDVVAQAEDLGKPVGRDVALDRPSAARELGLDGAVARLQELVDGALSAIPECPGREELATLLRTQAASFLPKELAQQAA
ncbi:MAG: polyprenyl synthetase family protein [Gammaproteobacteria bacterium]|nr:polyprenyl synthetase family protein [Gammaproteobacteria bacterium]TVQ46952.1 MAG: geranylgeranyl pyrophosphate synthase [Gammaproteobacteria bacterium]